MEQTDRSQSGGKWGRYWKRLAKEHRCIYAEPMDTDNNMVEDQDGGAW